MNKYFIKTSILFISLFVGIKCNLQAVPLQVVNLGRAQPESNGIQEFCSNLKQVYKEKEDQKQINKILERYRQNRRDPYAWEDAQIELQTSNISPARKREVQIFLNNLINHY